MPHFGLIHESLPNSEKMLLRAKLHMRGGDIRKDRGQYADAVAAYYDAMSSALRHFFLSKEIVECLHLPEILDIDDDEMLFIELMGIGVIHDPIDMEDFYWIEELLERAIQDDLTGQEVESMRGRLQHLMTQLRVLPIIEGELPKQHSMTL